MTAAHIGVTAKGGGVSLTGHVDSFVEKRAAEMAALRVKGNAVAQEIEVPLPLDTKRGDDEIAAAAIELLSWDGSLARDAVSVNVDRGWLTLTGPVDWHYQKRAVEQDVRSLFGVVGVSNQLTIRQKVNVSNLSEDITHALHRSVFFDPKTVAVSAQGGKVRLAGTVHSRHGRQVAASTAWAAPDVTAVQNDICVI